MPSDPLRTWVGDQLHSLLGYSEGHVADYVMSLSRTAKTPQQLLAKLQEADLPSSEATRRFASELFSRAPRQAAAGSSSTAREQRKETIKELRNNEKYAMLSEGDDEGEDEVNAAVQRALQEKERERKRAERAEKKRARGADEPASSSGKAAGGGGSGGGESSERQQEDAREEDLRERDAFAERLRLRDLERTRKAAGPEGEALAARQAEAEKLLSAGTAEEKAEALLEARKISRRQYLEMREKKMLAAARDDVRDEEFLFGDVELTERERKEMEYKKTVFELAEKRINLSDQTDRYVMPTAYDADGQVDQSKRFEGLLARYQEEEKEELNEFQAWDATQIKRSTAKVGAGDSRGRSQMGEGANQEYELVMAQEEQIEFISDEMLAGNLSGQASGEPPPSAKASKSMELAEVRKSLPVYAYRDDIIAAVQEHQVLIIVGETGSGKTTQVPQYL